MQRSERTFASSGVAVWFYVRGDLPATHDCQRPKSGYGMVLHARFRVAGAKSELRALAASFKFWPGWPAEDSPLGAQSRPRTVESQALPGRSSRTLRLQI